MTVNEMWEHSIEGAPKIPAHKFKAMKRAFYAGCLLMMKEFTKEKMSEEHFKELQEEILVFMKLKSPPSVN